MAAHRILVVDDDPDFKQLLVFDLKRQGYETITAANGEEGLEKAAAEKPDLIILDIKMPKVDGYTFVRRMNKEPEIKDIPVIVLTSYEPMKEMFKLEGVKDYFVKSADMKMLLSAVNKYVNGTTQS